MTLRKSLNLSGTRFPHLKMGMMTVATPLGTRGQPTGGRAPDEEGLRASLGTGHCHSNSSSSSSCMRGLPESPRPASACPLSHGATQSSAR